jgi:hypothetical protein
MIIHCSQKLATKLSAVLPTPLEETSPLGSWHGHLFTLDGQQGGACAPGLVVVAHSLFANSECSRYAVCVLNTPTIAGLRCVAIYLNT